MSTDRHRICCDRPSFDVRIETIRCVRTDHNSRPLAVCETAHFGKIDFSSVSVNDVQSDRTGDVSVGNKRIVNNIRVPSRASTSKGFFFYFGQPFFRSVN